MALPDTSIFRRLCFLIFLATFSLVTGNAELFGLSQEQTSGTDDVASEEFQDAKAIFTKYKPRNGKPHPDFILPSIDGKQTLQLSSYRGKKVLLLHFASW